MAPFDNHIIVMYRMSMRDRGSFPEIIRRAIRRDGRTLYRLALDSGVNSAVLGRFMRGERDLNLRTAERVCKALGLELRPMRRPRGKGR